MTNKGGAIHFEITADNDDLKRKLAESRQEILNSGKTAQEQGSKTEGMFKRMATGLDVVFTAQQAIGFAKQIAVVRGEFQQLEVAFSTILGSKEKANALMAQMVDTAAKTPLDLKSVAGGAKQLLAYGSSAEVVNKELIMLGNISAGLSIPLGDLVYLYGTTQTQGRLYTQDMQQFMERGIPLTEELAKQLGKTKQEISEMVTSGKIGFPEVQTALQAMTGDGGKFYNLMENQSKTITGQISNLGDAVDVMLNKIGTSQEGVISSVIGGATATVENYEPVLRILGTLMASYGTYKATLITVAAIQKLSLITEQVVGYVKMAQALGVATANQIAFNRASMLNPYVAIATVLAALAGGLVLYATRATDAEKDLTGLAKATKSAEEEFDKQAAKIDALRYTIEKSTVSYDRKKLAITELQKIIPNYNAELDNEGKLIRSNTSAIEDYLKALDRQIKLKIIEEERIEAGKTQRQAQKTYDATKKENDKKLYNSTYGKNNDAIIDVASWFGLKDEQKTQEALNEATKNLNNANLAVDELNTEIEKIELSTDGVTTKVKTFSEQLADAAGNVSKYKKELTDLKLGKGDDVVDFAKAIEAKSKELKEAESRYALLSGIDGKASQKDYSSEVVDLMLKTEQMKIEVMQNGRAKELAQIELTRQEKLTAIDKEQKDIEAKLKEQGKQLAPEQKASFDTQRTSVGLLADKDTVAVNKKYDDEIASGWRALTEVFLTEEEKRTGSVKNEYENRRKWLNELSNGGSINREEYVKMSLQIDASQAQAELQPLLDQYQTYADKRKEIEEKFNSEVATLQSKNEGGKYDGQIEQAEKQKKEALSKIDFDDLKEGIDFTQLFGNLDNMTLPSMEVLRDKIKAWIDTAGKSLSPEDFKTVSDAFQQLDIKITDKNPFGEFNDALVERKKATEEVSTAQDALNALQSKGIKSGAQYEEAQTALTEAQRKQAVAIAKQQAALSSAVDKSKQVFGAAQDVLGILENLGVEVSEDVSGAVDGVGQILDGLGSIDLTAPLSIITGFIKVIGGLIQSITSLFGGSQKTMDELALRQKEEDEKAYFAQMEINKQYRERYDWAQKIGESQLGWIERQGQELKKQSTASASDQDELMKKLMGTTYKSGERFEKTGLFGLGPGRIVSEQSSLEGKSWKEIEALAASGKLSEEGQKYFEALKKAKEEGEDLAQRQEEYLEQVRETFTGTTYSGVVDGIVEGFKAGKRSAADFAETFDELMQGAVTSALNLLADEKMRKWYEDFAQMGEDGYTEEEIAKAKEDYLRYVEQLAKDAEALEKATGIVVGSTQNDREATKRGIATASQESVNENNGLLTSIQGHTFELNEAVQNRISPNISSITESMTFIRDSSARQLEALHSIRDNTAPISDMKVEIGHMRTAIETIRDRGLTMKP